MRRTASREFFPPKRKRGFADLDARLAAGSMPNDAHPVASADLLFEGDSMPAPVITDPADESNPKVVSEASDSQILALFHTSLVQ